MIWKFRPPETIEMAFPMGSPLILIFLHIPVASSGQIGEIQATTDNWNGLSYGLPTDIAISHTFQWPLEVKTGKFRPPITFGMAFPMGLSS